MSRFYGQVNGYAKTTASRRGNSKSGIRSSVQSYDSSIAMYLRDTNYGMQLRIEHSDDSDMFGKTIFDGPMDEFVRMCLEHG